MEISEHELLNHVDHWEFHGDWEYYDYYDYYYDYYKSGKGGKEGKKVEGGDKGNKKIRGSRNKLQTRKFNLYFC